MTSALQHYASEVLLQILIDGGQLADVDAGPGPYTWPGYAEAEADGQDDEVTITTTTGNDDGRTEDGELQQHYGVQVAVRSGDKRSGYTKAMSLRAWLSETMRAAKPTLDGVTYLVMNGAKIGQVLPLGWDMPATARKMHTFNLTLPIRQLP